MKILLTGASSFTGYWFAKYLVERGHSIVAPLRGMKDSYLGLKAERLVRLKDIVDLRYEAEFGGNKFLEIINEGGDLIAHHASNVSNYRSIDFDVVGALESNTKNISRVLAASKSSGFSGVLYTGSVFEADEGIGDLPLRAFSPYGISKKLSSDLISYWANVNDLSFGKFVIPNPFGVLEEERLSAYLFKTWKNGDIPTINTPKYIRDNIPVTILAQFYALSAEEIFGRSQKISYFSPSGYVGTQQEFVMRLINEINKQTKGSKFDVIFLEQKNFDEPIIRINKEKLLHRFIEWDEDLFWSTYVEYYLKKFDMV